MFSNRTITLINSDHLKMSVFSLTLTKSYSCCWKTQQSLYFIKNHIRDKDKDKLQFVFVPAKF